MAAPSSTWAARARPMRAGLGCGGSCLFHKLVDLAPGKAGAGVGVEPGGSEACYPWKSALAVSLSSSSSWCRTVRSRNPDASSSPGWPTPPSATQVPAGGRGQRPQCPALGSRPSLWQRQVLRGRKAGCAEAAWEGPGKLPEAESWWCACLPTPLWPECRCSGIPGGSLVHSGPKQAPKMKGIRDFLACPPPSPEWPAVPSPPGTSPRSLSSQDWTGVTRTRARGVRRRFSSKGRPVLSPRCLVGGPGLTRAPRQPFGEDGFAARVLLVQQDRGRRRGGHLWHNAVFSCWETEASRCPHSGSVCCDRTVLWSSDRDRRLPVVCNPDPSPVSVLDVSRVGASILSSCPW